MSIIVQKFGGTSVGSVERILNCAQIVKREVDAGNQVAVAVSAMAGETNRLLALADDIDPAYARAMMEARAAGVEVFCYQCAIDETSISVTRPLVFL